METKQHLFDAAFKMLEEKPYEEITVRDIVKAADVSTGTFYLYYKTKLDVYYETYVLADKYFDTTVRRAVSRCDTTEKKLHCFFKSYARYSSEITSLALTKLLYNSDNKCFMRNINGGMRDLLSEIISEGLENGSVKSSESASDITEFLMIAIRGRVYDWCIHDGGYSLADLIEKDLSKLLEIYL